MEITPLRLIPCWAGFMLRCNFSSVFVALGVGAVPHGNVSTGRGLSVGYFEPNTDGLALTDMTITLGWSGVVVLLWQRAHPA